MIDVIAAVYRA